ncbi:MAG: ABC transporter ATP-binding protein [Alphaproteobacteria bacterium]|nr:ABC transporter ATP-binding protein [Alphaproteobacteria bacterium]MBU0796343.1 ABC transporter ATP-binding protein [Alphaproteobacteria bacterium]MBU0887768.1 ABC transporter ATP-binding protein [Alphaproteobacteria bacterium]MBU1815009.1 ABC transporter ATP-binding protein [Alphaproteobacteria bacterium]MBU2090419.1 ABC transporter ATP-binding protein [Alphaproteobacteria bacterium]
MSDNTPVLEVKNLTVRLPRNADRENAVENVNLVVHPKEILCVVGESGSGKSVTAHTVMGLLPKKQLTPVAGQVLLQGEDLLTASASRMRDLRASRMSMIFQEPMTALNPVMPVGDQIDELLQVHTKMSPAERLERVLAVMEDVRLPDPKQMRTAYPHQLSGGQRQRIMIAMALALNPVLLIADEPTTALDVTTQAQILRLIKDLQSSHDTGVLFITHDFGVVAEIADRVAVMQFGKLVEFGDAKQMLRNPQHPYTRMLISSVPGIKPKHREPIPARAPIVLETTALEKTYGGSGFFNKNRVVHAAKDVNLTIRRGETLGIVGESGSGKSTVARCIVRLVDPSSGSIHLHDLDIASLSASLLRRHRKKVQIVFQDPYRSLNPRRTVGQSIVEGPMNFGLSSKKAWERARDLMNLVGLDPHAVDRFPHQFSGGQRQRICIARALAMEPELLIADEAVSALDVSVQAQVLELLDNVRKEFDLAMLFITHDLRVAAQVCDRVAVMFKGEVVEYGPASEVFAAPKHEYTQALFEAAPGRDWDFGKFDAA